MTTNLNSRSEISKLDTKNMLGSIEALADQVRHAWDEVQKIQVPNLSHLKNVVVAGMGGSALGPDVIKYLFKDSLTMPFEIVNSYDLPAYVNSDTLVILSSYSGTTEETLACADQAQTKQAQIMVICAGGNLADLAKVKNYPLYLINPVHNPSNQPRMAIGYSIFGVIGLLAKAGILNVTQEEINQVITTIIAAVENNTVEIDTAENQAKTLAYSLIGLQPRYLAAEFLQGAVHAATNQHNENAKVAADYLILPEINHHLMEGLKFPESNISSLSFVFLQSDLYLPRIHKRMELTQEIVDKQNIPTVQVQLLSETKFTQVFEAITLLSFTGFYLAMLEGIDPSPIPYVDWFKEQLK